MEEKIKQTLTNLKIQYILFWAFPILLVIGGEMEYLPVGLYADDGGMQYVLETVGILFTILLIPVTLKYFGVILNKKKENATFPEALNSYLFWSACRLGILESVALLNLSIYYLTLGNMGSLCALIALTASLFCLPGDKRLRSELKIINREEE